MARNQCNTKGVYTLNRLSRLLVLFVAAFLFSGCWYAFERKAQVSTGEVSGTAVLADNGTPASFARIEPIGAGFTQTADVTGAFRVQGLSPGGWAFSIQHDHNGDGWPEQAAMANAFLTLQEEADGLIGVGDVKPGSWIFGQVVLEGTGMILGAVTLDGQPVAGARVVIFRDNAIPTGLTDDLSGFSAVSLMESNVESFHSTDSQGRYFIPGVTPGKLMLAALLQIDEAGSQWRTSSPVEVDVAANQEMEST